MKRSRSLLTPIMGLLVLMPLVVLPSCGGNGGSTGGSAGSTGVEPGVPNSDEQSLLLLGAMKADSALCVVKAEASAPLLAAGVLDLAFRSSYSAFLLVQSRLLAPGSAKETQRVSLLGVEITLTTLDGTVLDKHSDVAASSIQAGTASVAYGFASVTLIPHGLGEAKSVQSAASLLAKIRVLGETSNGTALTSSELVFPIRVCTGCLVEYPASAADPFQPAGADYLCSSNAAAAAAPAPCLVGQDVSFSCALCVSSVSLCRDPRQNPSFAP
jgi:hypothetical protein